MRPLVLRALLAAILTGFAASWFYILHVITTFHPNGTVDMEAWWQRDLSGRLRHAKTVKFYSNGQKSAEGDAGLYHCRYWAPDGRSVSEEESRRFAAADNGDGTFREP